MEADSLADLVRLAQRAGVSPRQHSSFDRVNPPDIPGVGRGEGISHKQVIPRRMGPKSNAASASRALRFGHDATLDDRRRG